LSFPAPFGAAAVVFSDWLKRFARPANKNGGPKGRRSRCNAVLDQFADLAMRTGLNRKAGT